MEYTLLFYFCSLAGFVMVIGGIWLLYKQKIYIDRETKQITEVEFPLGIKFKTNIPVLALFALGFVPLIYPIMKSTEIAQEMEIQGGVESDDFSVPVIVYAAIQEDTLHRSGDFTLRVPSRFPNFKVLYIAGPIVYEQRLDRRSKQKGKIVVPTQVFSAGAKGVPQAVPLPPVPAQYQQQ